ITAGPDITPLPTLVLGRVRRVLGGLVLGDGLLDILQPELELVRIELLGAAAKLVPCQALNQQPQLVVLGGQRRILLRRRGDHLAQHPLQDGRIIRQGIKVDRHALIMNNALASRPAIRVSTAAFSTRPTRVCEPAPARAIRSPRARSRVAPPTASPRPWSSSARQTGRARAAW